MSPSAHGPRQKRDAIVAVVVEDELGAVREIDGRVPVVRPIDRLSQHEEAARREHAAVDGDLGGAIREAQPAEVGRLVGEVRDLDPLVSEIAARGIDEQLVDDHLARARGR
ncbi:MAG TPA: hypothetical protein VMT47_15930, partial [Polyangia bacterium]|nr:hypothetical protein [Polyangia bacterium]